MPRSGDKKLFVNARVLGVLVVLGLLLVGLAIFYMADPRDPPREKRSLPGKASTSKTVPSEKTQRAEPPPALRPRTPISRDEEPTREEEPEITLDDARKDFAAFIADLDRELERLEKSGGKLTEAEYTKYRVRGANAIDAVLRRLDHQDPNMIIEIKEMQEAARTRLDKIEPK